MVTNQPENKDELLNIEGMGEKTYQRYGEEILKNLDKLGSIEQELIGRITIPKIRKINFQEFNLRQTHTVVSLETKDLSSKDKIIELAAVEMKKKNEILKVTDKF
ncbi:MAG: HRDC domain-containing protein [Bacillota bacterium]